ncbi:helix-turn-helix domain-containing protein [Methylophilus medardicus]|uniref:DNA binding HTH domain-containing protein n=1 Tax=Methylophilus medardicus TaxID=2588534 RepID=A0A5B8CU49_9PROT|nr:helix-turn-helix domain-containing protein [Methylophilus medardicus]QDC44769.1 hypothetical protein FIU01_09720 [Methylophilus medardicus]QDC49776.1 hypothetical protein FIU00_09720 [Methylophilus medardicus]QDC53481.1 hypothetical protein FIT99_09720 [Methylophilus medardicus]
MPRVKVDSELLAEVQALEAAIGNQSKLAHMLGVDRSTLLRFCSTGKAIDKTRETMRKGLIRYKNETTGSSEKVSASIGATLTGNIQEDMQMLRSLCTTVLTVLDGYEKLLANGTNNN